MFQHLMQPISLVQHSKLQSLWYCFIRHFYGCIDTWATYFPFIGILWVCVCEKMENHGRFFSSFSLWWINHSMWKETVRMWIECLKMCWLLNKNTERDKCCNFEPKTMQKRKKNIHTHTNSFLTGYEYRVSKNHLDFVEWRFASNRFSYYH